MTTQPSAFRRSVSPGNIILIVGLCVFGLVALMAAFKYLLPDDAPSAPGASSDVTITGCSGTDRVSRASVSVTNSADGVRDYAITVAFYDSAGTQIGTGFASILDLAPGKSAVDQVSSLNPGPPARCAVTTVRRH